MIKIKFYILPLLVSSLVFSVGATAQTEASRLLPAINLLLLEDSESISDIEAARFLMQTSFGPTEDTILALTNLGYERWLNQQFNAPISYHLDFQRDVLNSVNNNGQVSGAIFDSWALVSANADDQLRQRMAFLWSELFVISRLTMRTGVRGFIDYYDVLLDHSFDNFRDLLETVTLNSMMGAYLSTQRNRRRDLNANPPVVRADENYAREVMQLFTIGLEELNLDGTRKLDRNGEPIPTFTEQHVEEFAKVFTGFAFGDSFVDLRATAGRSVMRGYPEFHDQRSKSLLNGLVLPPGQSPEKDLKDALDNLFNHANTAPFICKQIIQKLVTSNPTPAYVRACSNSFNNDRGVNRRGDIKRVLKTILLHDEARNGHKTMPATFGKLKEPLIHLIGIWRAMNLKKRNGFVEVHRSFIAGFNQLPLKARTVFNFFSPQFSPPGVLANNSLLAPEAQMLSLSSVINGNNVKYVLVDSAPAGNPNSRSTIELDGARFKSLVPDDLKNPEQFIDRMNLLLMAGGMPAEMRTSLLKMHNQSEGYIPRSEYDVMTDILRLIAASPYSNIQR